MLPNKLDDIFRRQSLKDLILIGFGDDMWGVKTFHASMEAIFLEFENTTLKLTDPQDGIKIQMTIVDKGNYSLPYEIEPEDELIIFPALHLFTRYEPSTVCVEKLTLFYDQYCDLSIPEYRAVGIDLSDYAGYLFFDPLNWSGIRIGSKDKEKEFVSNMKDKVGEVFGELIIKTIDYGTQDEK